MSSKELRKKFLDFFKNKDHNIVKSSSLLPNDSSVLFTTAGMQQFKEYYLDKKSPYGNKVASCQKCFRTSDIEEVGDERHLTFFEMLGNFSFGDYFKKEAIYFAKEFLDTLNLKIDYVTVFEGDGEIQKDVDSYNVWKELGFSEEKNNLIFKGRDENFWGPTGEEGPCGPTTEIYINGIEIWNLVFNEYFQDKNKKLTLLKKKGVDTGMGLERLSMIVQNKPTIFETDLFLPIIKEIENQFNLKYENNNYYFRIIADHIKSAVFLISENIYPSNIERGYILRRLIRRAIRYGKLMNLPSGFLLPLAKKVIEIYKDVYCEIKLSENNILTVILNEEEKFEKTLNKGLKQFEKIAEKKEITGEEAFHLYDTYGFPIELTKELADEKNIKVDIGGFYNFFKKHQEVSRKGVEAKFGGIGKNADYNATRLHTATHLLQSALREVLGESVRQMGSDINSFRLRFDFSFPRKLTNEELQKIEGIVNQKIKEDLEVKREEMSYEKAIRSGALSFFKEKYPPKVSVYSIGDFSKEICAGPHVKKTSELKKFKIIKEESSGANIRRIRAVLE
ncbi:MAG TPA: alanine--tRNA ligase [Candidatus Pacearchaeota archaeon]|nr:alanine--tRNA ligase [Candidatus Pacearchaeota archaeon]HOL90169.1 alanine--tRNA ligase [Candidatus Pacearchaeota archaeon]HOW12714.1 alanine--tRNA ligase [Candidatus Pacearchaeota archaeon]HPO68270.1 alanine--tRNA ligase [Candidatus Pacearchaeota archaeon]